MRRVGLWVLSLFLVAEREEAFARARAGSA
jgi:hypothetical protein